MNEYSENETHRNEKRSTRKSKFFSRQGVVEELVENGQERRTYSAQVSSATQRKIQMMTLGNRVLELSEKDLLQRVKCRKTVRLL